LSARSRRVPSRVAGYAPLRDYAAIGDGETVALVALDGSVDWLCLPRHDSEPVLAGLLDAAAGGRFTLAPAAPFEAERRYLPDSNVLETTFTTAEGRVRVTDALDLDDGGTLPWRELARRAEGLSGSVRMRWSFELSTHLDREPWARPDGPQVVVVGGQQLALLTWDAGAGDVELRQGETAHLVVVAADPGPFPCPTRDEVEGRLCGTVDAWRRWLREHTYDGPWNEPVERSLLALKLLICSRTGAIVAAPTTSLPERIGGERNWDYRYAWPRDSGWTIASLISLGFREQAQASFAWLLQAVGGTRPDVASVYELDGSVLRRCEERNWPGYRGSRPVCVGNRAGEQLQLGGYADLLDTAWAYACEGNLVDPQSAALLVEVVDHVCEIWERPDAGIWELDEPRPYTQSKIACWTALRRALDLVEASQLPGDARARWEQKLAQIEAFVEERCWSEERGAYVQHAGGTALDAAELLCARRGYGDVDRDRVAATVDAIRRELARGALLYRYSGMEVEEGAFVACSFWLVEALARLDRADEACELMEETLAFANDVGLYSEEIDPSTGDFLGNFPQGLSHLSLIRAAVAVQEATDATPTTPARAP
jgi:GH15 family glucan-1,4-alpha-glucosidase